MRIVDFPIPQPIYKKPKKLNQIIQIKKKQWIEKRLETIRTVTKNNYLYHELPSNNVLLFNEDPADVLNTINEVDPSNSSIRMFINLLSEPIKDQLREQLGIKKGNLNNKTPNEVIDILNKKLEGYGQNQSFVELIEYSINLNPQGKTFGLHNRIAAVFELLDMLGFWTDKFNAKSNYARLWDSNHAYFSGYCDYFISDDKRTRNKTKVAFDIYNIKTKVLSTKELDE